MNIESALSPAADPAGLGPAPDRAESAVQMPVDAAAVRELERAQIDELSAITLDALRVLRIEILDPKNSPTDIPGLWVCANDPTLAYVRLTRSARLNLAARARMAADDAEKGIAETPEAAALRCRREQQIAIEMSAIGMDFMRVVQQEILDSYHAPTQGQGLRMHAGDPALAISRLSHAIRMNHAIRAKIAEGSLGQRRRATSAAPGRPDRQPRGASASERVAADEGAHKEAKTEGLATGCNESESEDFWSELGDDLERELDEFAFLDDVSLDGITALTRRVYERNVAIYRRRHQPATQDDPVEPDPPDPDEDRDLPDSPVAELAASVQAVLNAMSAPNGPEDALRRLAETLAAASHRLGPPGHDPP